MSKEPLVRRSTGMLGSPREARSRAVPDAPMKPQAEAPPAPERSTSRHPKPKVLMGEVTAPIPKLASGDGAEQFGRQRFLLRSFMQKRGLRPSEWAREAGIPSGELLGFLTGRVRAIAPATLEKLARAANCTVADFFR